MALRVGVIGGGQLARMMIAPAVELGLDLRVLAEGDGMSARLAATAVGDYRDLAVVRSFAADVDVITFDHEHVPQDVLRALVADGVAVHPGPDALQFAQDKLVMRARLAELGIPQPDWAAVHDTAELQDFLDAHRGRAVVKTPRGGYDGKGVRVIGSADEAQDWMDAVEEGDALLVEELVPFVRELAQQVARSVSGEIVAYPVVETVQRDGVCAEVIAPAPAAAERLVQVAEQIGRTIAEGVGVTGMLAVELFETDDERILVNELAMRPHNSGHWSQDGAVTRPVRAAPACGGRSSARQRVPPCALVGDGQHPRRAGGGRAGGAIRRRHGGAPDGQDPHLRQGSAPRPQGRPRERGR
ncbi:5-(carboxyamino)imidazole ribonucleotide synthase [Microbacterium sp. W4I20]|nr:5-(carboxyamino)imidazole ribonucleotide synthase [Microbacterium sp. W4I20]